MSKSLDRKYTNSTLMYAKIAKVVFATSLNDEFRWRVAETPEEINRLVEAGSIT